MTELAITTADAESLEAAFLGGMDEAQYAFERILASEAWTALGFDSLGHWWDERVKPTMRALSMSPSKELAIAVVEKVREEEANLPPAQRRTQRDLADMVGVSQGSPAIRPRSAPERDLSPADLEQHRTPATSTPEPTSVAPAATEMPARQDDAETILAHLDERVKQAHQIADDHQQLRADLQAIPADTMAAIKESVKPAVDSWSLVEACRELVRALSSVDIDLATKAIDPDRQSTVFAAIAILRRVERALGVPA